jgi:hypothetical protein
VNRKLSGREIVFMLLGCGASLAVAGSGYQAWTDTAVVLLLSGPVVLPLLVLGHELGHAVVGVALTGQRAHVELGDEPFKLRFALGKIDVAINRKIYPARCTVGARMGAGQVAIFALAGPIASLALAVALCFAAIALYDGSPVFFCPTALAAGLSLLIGLANAAPFRRPPRWFGPDRDGGASDGYVALSALRHGRWPRQGVKPATEQRYFANRARRAVAAGHEAAHALGSGHLGTEHLLLGLLCEGSGQAALTLERFGLTLARLQEQMRRLACTCGRPRPERLPFTPAAKKALLNARGTLSLRGDQEIDAEHMLLGLLQESEGLAVTLMRQSGVDPDAVRRAVLSALQSGTAGTAAA